MKQKGFTLIELLVVISIIGLLASVVLVALNGARQKARITRRIADLSQIQKALELYYNDNNKYPSTGGAWNSVCTGWNTTTANGTIPGLVPTYMSSIPTDPAMSQPLTNCYLYRSLDGTDYKFMAYNIADMTPAQVTQYPTYLDPANNGVGVANCGPAYTSPNNVLSIYSPGARCW